MGEYESSASDVLVDAKGRIVLAGNGVRQVPNQEEWHDETALARLNPDGSIDTTFGQSGRFELFSSVPSGPDIGALAVAGQGSKYVVAEYFCPSDCPASGTPNKLRVSRLTEDGTLDSSFGSDGSTVAPFNRFGFHAAIAVDANGRVVVAGGGTKDGVAGFAIARFTPTGEPDPSFGEDGSTVIPVGSYNVGDSYGLTLTPDGEIFVGGYSQHDPDSRLDFTVAKLKADGSVDSAFADAGVFSLPHAGYATALARRSNGRLVVAGIAQGDIALLQLLPDGSPDPSFGGGDGWQQYQAPTQGSHWGAGDIALDGAGRIVVGGTLSEASAQGFVVIRTTPTGDLDPTFGSGGISAQLQPIDRGEQLAAIALQADEKVVAAGTLQADPDGDGFAQGFFGAQRFFGGPVVSPPPRSYLALGDSVAAGEGTNYGFHWVPSGQDGTWVQSGPSDPSWDTTFVPDDCHQGPAAHPRVLAAELGLALTHLACTGAAGVNGILSPQDGMGVPAQLGYTGMDGNAPYGPPNPAYDAANPDVVTLSVGANDVDFVSVVLSCLDPVRSCAMDQDLRIELAAARAQQRAALNEILDEIARRASPGAPPVVVVTGYPDPLPASYPENEPCRDVKDVLGEYAGFSSGEISFMHEQLRKLNESIKAAAVAHDTFATFVASPPSFSEHTFCSEDPWVYGPSLVLGAGIRGFLSAFASHLASDGWLIAAKKALTESEINPAPFHPTAIGQQAIANNLESVISQVRHTSAGTDVPVNLPSGVQLEFSSVHSAGETIVTSESNGAAIPTSPSIARTWAGEIHSTATYSGPITVRVPGTSGQTLFHYSDGAWQAVGDSHYNEGFVTGTVSSLSPFALGTRTPLVSAAFSHTGTTTAPATISFDGSASIADSGSIASYEWDFGDGTTASGPRPTHSYATSGTYPVTLQVRNDQGAVDQAADELTINNELPVAQLSGPSGGEVGQLLSFSAVGSSDLNGTVAGWLWDFGDGSSLGSTPNITHAYAIPGTYTVRLTVFDNEGDGVSQVRTITVTALHSSGGGPTGGGGAQNQQGGAGSDSARAKALKKCKKKRKKARSKCRKRAKRLPT